MILHTKIEEIVENINNGKLCINDVILDYEKRIELLNEGDNPTIERLNNLLCDYDVTEELLNDTIASLNHTINELKLQIAELTSQKVVQVNLCRHNREINDPCQSYDHGICEIDSSKCE